MTPIVAVTTDGGVVPYPDDAPVTEVDVRGDLRAGRNPLSKILAAVRNLEAGEVLRIRTTFAPIALVEILAAQGFVHHLSSEGDRDWSVSFWRPGGAPPLTTRRGPRRTRVGHVYSILTRRFQHHG